MDKSNGCVMDQPICRRRRKVNIYSSLLFFFQIGIAQNIVYRLFFGSKHAINVTSIRMIENNLNLETVIGEITALDNLISGKRPQTRYKYDSKLRALFDYILHGKRKSKWNQYIFDTFRCFVRSKTKIEINISRVTPFIENEVELALLNLIFNKLNNKNDELMDDGNVTNLTRPEIFQIFENVGEITLRTAHDYKSFGMSCAAITEYGFSLFGFLSIIKDTRIKKATIYGEALSHHKGWISGLWTAHEEEIVAKYAAGNFSVKFTPSSTNFPIYGGGSNSHSLLIEKL